MTCGTKAVHWASFVSESFKEYFYRNLRFRKLQDVVKIDGSIFGRRVFHRGNTYKIKSYLKYYLLGSIFTLLLVFNNK